MVCFFAILSCHPQHEFPAQKHPEKKPEAIFDNRSVRFTLPQTIIPAQRPQVIQAINPVVKIDVTKGGAPFFTNYGVDQGLPLNSVFCSATDKEGNLWFGTIGGGVSKYDGKNFTNYTIAQGLVGNVVISVMEDKAGNLWFGTSSGVSRYDGYRFTNYTTTQGLAGNYVSCIMQDSWGNLWFGTQEGGASRFNGKSFTNYAIAQGLPDKYIRCMMQDKNGNIWLGTGSAGVTKYDGKLFTNFSTKQGLAKNTVNSVAQDHAGNLWFGTNGGLSKYDWTGFSNYTTAQGLADNALSSVVQDKTGAIWVGSFTKGICKFDGKSFINYTRLQGLADNNITSILQDRNGGLWFTSHGGVSKYEGNSLTNYTAAHGLAGNMVFKIMQDTKGNHWFCTYEGGVSKYDGKCFTNYTTTDGLPDMLVWNMMQDKSGNIWFGTDKGGLSKFDGRSFTNYTTSQGLPNNTVNCICQDTAGNIWIGTHGGVSKYDGRSFTNFTKDQGLIGNNVLQIIQDKAGNLWFATHDDGVSKYDGNRFTSFTRDQGLVSNKVYSLIQDKAGNIWIGTNAGVSKYDGKTFTNFTTEQGLADNYIWSIVEDQLNNMIWFGTNQGLSGLKQMPPTSGNKPAFEFENFNKTTGYPIREVNSNALFVDNKGIIWVGSGHNELLRFDYTAINKNANPLNLIIQAVKINNEPVCWNNLLGQELENIPDSLTILNEMIGSFGKVLSPDDLNSMRKKYAGIHLDRVSRFYPIPVNLVLPDEHNNISIDFTAIEPVLQKQVKYQYMLLGYSKDWSPLSNNSTAVFGNIGPGEYIFKLRAVSPFGVWSATEYSFKVLPPWWATWWAYTLYVLLIGSIGYGIYRNRIKSLKRKQFEQIKAMVATQEEERKRISSDLHDDVGTRLSALKLFISALNEKANQTNNEEIKSLAVSSEQFITEAVRDVRQLLQNLSPAMLEEFGYITAIESLVNKINEAGQIHFELISFGMKGGLQKAYDLALYRITQELINNILKHAEAKHVTLQVGQRDEKIILMIEDDGKGFDISSRNEGYGLNNLAARTKLLNGVITIDTFPGKGTSVLIEIPYKHNRI
jgi:signal transduction histidine kinase/ligand-binding sensor domain-containing protein